MKTSFFVLLLLIAEAASATQFAGYSCTKDCSGHKAGYAWAKKRQLTEPGQCQAKTQSFREGCLAYVDARQKAR